MEQTIVSVRAAIFPMSVLIPSNWNNIVRNLSIKQEQIVKTMENRITISAASRGFIYAKGTNRS